MVCRVFLEESSRPEGYLLTIFRLMLHYLFGS